MLVFASILGIILYRGYAEYGFSLIDFFLSIAIFLILFNSIIFTFNLFENIRILNVCKKLNQIAFKQRLNNKIIYYSYDELDGYVTGRIRNRNRGSFNTYKVIWIVKDNKMIERIDERYFVNYNELEAELKELPYLGYQKIRLWKRLKMLFSPIEID